MNDLPDNVTLRFLDEKMQLLLAQREADRADMLTVVSMIQRVEANMALLGQRVELLGQRVETNLASFSRQLNDMHAYNRSLGERLRRLEETTLDKFQRLETLLIGIGERLSSIEAKSGGKP
jgi:hypothetical protein